MRRTRSLCCARAASGHAAAPPSNVMNSRRLKAGMGLSHPVQPVSRTLSLARRDRPGPWDNPESVCIDHLAAIDAADLDQDRRHRSAATSHIMLNAIAVFARSELRKRPFPRIQAIALLLNLDLIGARHGLSAISNSSSNSRSARSSRARA